MQFKFTSLLFLMLLFFACSEKEVAPVEEAIRPVRYKKVIKTNSVASATFSGVAQSSKEAKLSFKVSGTLNRLNVKVGDRVRKGQQIATLDAIDYSIESDRAVANLKNAETQIKAAETQRVTTKSAYERVELLYENNSIPLNEYEQAKASYEAAESQYEASQAQMVAAKKQAEGARNQVSYARLSAPFNGVITAVEVEENELVGSGNPVAVLSAEGNPEVRVGVPESYIGQVRKGKKVDIEFSILSGKNFKGTVSEVAFSSSDASTYPVIIRIDKPESNIRPGMATNVKFSNGSAKGKAPVVIAPANSIGKGNSGNFAFVLQKSGANYKAKLTNIQIGKLLPEGFEIKSGLNEGDMVATAGLQSLLDGMEVRLLEGEK